MYVRQSDFDDGGDDRVARRGRVSILLSFALCMIVGWSGPAFSAGLWERVRVCAVRGSVEVSRMTVGFKETIRTCTLDRGAEDTRCVIVSVPYSVTTGPDSYAEIEAPKSIGKIRIRPNSRLLFEDSDVMHAQKGEYWMRVKIARDGHFYIKCPTTALGIRGTELEVCVNDQGTESIRLLSGVVEVSDLDGSHEFTLQAGQEVTVATGSAPPQPRPIDTETLDAWWEGWPKLVPIDGQPPFGPLLGDRVEVVPVDRRRAVRRPGGAARA